MRLRLDFEQRSHGADEAAVGAHDDGGEQSEDYGNRDDHPWSWLEDESRERFIIDPVGPHTRPKAEHEDSKENLAESVEVLKELRTHLDFILHILTDQFLQTTIRADVRAIIVLLSEERNIRIWSDRWLPWGRPFLPRRCAPLSYLYDRTDHSRKRDNKKLVEGYCGCDNNRCSNCFRWRQVWRTVWYGFP